MSAQAGVGAVYDITSIAAPPSASPPSPFRTVAPAPPPLSRQRCQAALKPS
ncbi:MAG: hypothetical protein ACPIOQ_19555 [Promethearchaeia archaeon]